MNYNRTYLFLFLLTLFGLVIRLWGLGNDGLHTDEEYSLNLTRHSLDYILSFALTQDCNPPLFYILDHLSVLIFGATRWAVRFPSVIAGTLLIPVTFVLGREMEDEYTGLLSATFIATLGSMWYYSQFGRSYMTVALLFAITAIFFVRIVRGSDQWNWYGLVLFTVLCAYTHLYSLIPLLFMWLYLLWIKPNRTLLFASLSIVLSLPLTFLGYSILTGRTSGSILAIGNTIPQLILIIPLEFFGYSIGIFAALIIYAVWTYRKETVFPVLIGIAVSTIIVQLAVSTVTPVFTRYTLLLIPVLVVVAMVPVSRFMRGASLPIQKYFIVSVLFLLYFGTLVIQATSDYYMPKG